LHMEHNMRGEAGAEARRDAEKGKKIVSGKRQNTNWVINCLEGE